MKKGSYLYYALANGMFYYAWGTFACIISVYLAGIGFIATDISLITSAAPLFAIFFQPVCGILADKVGSPKKVGMASLIFAVISGILFAYTKNLILLFLFNGLTQGFLNGTTALTDRLATGAPYPFGTIRIWGSICYAIACQVTGYVYDNLSHQAIYIIFTIAIIITIICFIGMNDVQQIKSEKKEESFTVLEMLKALFTNKAFVIFMIIYILFQGPASANGVYMPLLIKELGGSTTLVGTTLLFSTLSEIPAVLFSDQLIKKIPYKYLMLFACILTIIRFVWYSTYPTPTMIMMMFFFQGLTTIIFILVAVRIILDIVDERFVNSAYGISSMLAKGVAAFVFQMLSGNIIDAFGGAEGFRMVYLMYSVSILIATIVCIMFKMPEHSK